MRGSSRANYNVVHHDVVVIIYIINKSNYNFIYINNSKSQLQTGNIIIQNTNTAREKNTFHAMHTCNPIWTRFLIIPFACFIIIVFSVKGLMTSIKISHQRKPEKNK